jgi:hypothetical protein
MMLRLDFMEKDMESGRGLADPLAQAGAAS